jgi:translation initiation factor 1
MKRLYQIAHCRLYHNSHWLHTPSVLPLQCQYDTAMSKKNNARPDGLVYSTNPDHMNNYEPEAAGETAPNDKQKLRVRLDSKQRAGKLVTLVDGFSGTNNDLEDLGKKLKTKCGAGGSAKDGIIMVQGDYKEKIIAWLKEWGYTLTK